MRHLKNENGLSLVELLATLLITIMLGMIAYGILFNGFKAYERAKIETELRDEADLIMAELINEFFLLKESEITAKYLPRTNTANYYVEKGSEQYGFIDGKLYTGTEVGSVLQGDTIILSSESKITEPTPGQYHIILTLEWASNQQTLTTESEISTINDKE